MAHIHKGQLTESPQWAKHLKWWKRVFWSAERKAAQDEIRVDLCEGDLPDEPIQHRRPSKKIKKRYGLEIRHKPVMDFEEKKPGEPYVRSYWKDEFTAWRTLGWYETKVGREKALMTLRSRPEHQSQLLEWKTEYRKIDR